MATVQTGIATSFIDFTRASNATVTDSDGKVKWAPHNLLLASESFDAASWTKNISLIAANSIAAPNGTTTADKLYPSTSGTKSGVLARPTAVEEQYTLSVYAKAGGKNFITFTDFSAGSARAWANLSTGAKTETAGYFLTVTSVGSGWWRCDFTQTAKVASPYAFFIVCDADSSDAVTVNGTDGIYLWGASLYRSDLGGMQPNTSAYPMYNPTTPKNLLGFTEDFSANPTPWSNTRGSIIANSTTGPVNGLQTADAFNQIAASTAWALLQQTSSVAAGRKVFSVYAKPNGKNYLIMQANLNGAGNALTWFNVATGAAGTTNASHTALTPVSLGNGWWRFAIALDTTAATWSFGVGLADTDNSTTVTDVGGLCVWGAQLSDSASLDAYSPVYGAAVTSAAYYGPRRDFDPVTLACKGLLVEEQRTNTILNSSVFSGWAKATATVLDNQVAGPDGTITAGVITATAANGEIYTQVTSTSGVAHAGSIYVKRKTGTGSVYLIDAAGGRILVTASITTGSWTRISVTANSASVNPFFGIRLATSGDEIYLWGAQLEPGSFATSYIPTGAATATRNADVASVSTQAFPYSSTEGTVVVNASSPCIAAIANMITLDNGTTQERIRLLTDVASVKTIVTESNTTQANLSPGSATANTPFKFAVAYKVNDFAAVVNGSAAATDAAGNVPVVNIARLGADSSGNYLNGHIRQITYLPRRISNTELQTRTA